MNIIAYKNDGSIYFDEFRNDDERINEIIRASSKKEYLDVLLTRIGPDSNGVPLDDIITDRWNDYMNATIQVLEDAGCKIVWDI